jgi:hypothetical protein
MRLYIQRGESEGERKEREREWHAFFAIWPRRVSDGELRCLEWLERSATHYSGKTGHEFKNWSYRVPAAVGIFTPPPEWTFGRRAWRLYLYNRVLSRRLGRTLARSKGAS